MNRIQTLLSCSARSAKTKTTAYSSSKTFTRALLCFALLFTSLTLLVSNPRQALAESEPNQIKILFTHDTHSYLEPCVGVIDGVKREFGGSARLATLLSQQYDDSSIYVDAGDFSMGTLMQAAYASDAYELRTLGMVGCSVVTFGNHEWDYGAYGLANMLNAAVASGDTLPAIVASNISFEGKLSEEQVAVQDAFDNYGVQPYTLLERNGLTIGIFGISGNESIEDSPTSGMNWLDPVESAKETVAELEGQCDVIVCLSHSGTEGDGENGEDIELAKAVPGIDVIVSGHSHTCYTQPVQIGTTYIVSSSEYLQFLGALTLSVEEDGSVSLVNYELLSVDETVAEQPEVKNRLAEFKANVEQGYLANSPTAYDEIIANSPFDFMSLDEMYATHQEYPMGDLIADSYLYEARNQGITDIDVALVGLGTIRDSFYAGPISTADAFRVCSLGVGADGSAGHPLVSAYITGEELMLLVELDASLGPMVSSIKMSYSGLEYSFNKNRMILDRVTDVYLVREDGSREEIQADKLYRVCCNMYAANMLGMLNGLTKGILSIAPKYEDGSLVEDFYTCSLLNSEGEEIKEWHAFRNYLMSFKKTDGVSEIPEVYASAQGRKVVQDEGGLSLIANPGVPTIAVMLLGVLVIAALALIVRACVKRARKRKEQ